MANGRASWNDRGLDELWLYQPRGHQRRNGDLGRDGEPGQLELRWLELRGSELWHAELRQPERSRPVRDQRDRRQSWVLRQWSQHPDDAPAELALEHAERNAISRFVWQRQRRQPVARSLLT